MYTRAQLGLMWLFTGFLIACSAAPLHNTKASFDPPVVGKLSIESSPVPAITGTGAPETWARHATLTIRWPARSVQLIPSDTESILFRVLNYYDGTLIASASVSRPANAATSSITLPEAADSYLPTGFVTLSVQAKNGANTVVAEASRPTEVFENRAITVSMTLISTRTPTPAPTPTPTPTPAPTPTPTPTPAPLFTQVNGVPGLEMLSAGARLFSGDLGNSSSPSSWYPVRALRGIARSKEGDVRFQIWGLDSWSIKRILPTIPYRPTDLENICTSTGTNVASEIHDAVFKLASDGNSLEFVDAGASNAGRDKLNKPCTYYRGWDLPIFFSEWSTHSSNTLLQGVNTTSRTMTIKAGTIPSGETSLPIPEYFSDSTFETSRMTDTSTALWYISFGYVEDYTDKNPMQNLAIARWQFSTKQWVKTVSQNKVLQYFSNSTGDMYQGCGEVSCDKARKIRYVIHSASEGKFYLLTIDTGRLSGYEKYCQIYRISEEALTD